jgi:Fe-S oxidoreductase
MIANLKNLVHATGNGNGQGQAAAENNESEVSPDSIIGNAFDEHFIWYCRTCTACMEVCPAMIEHADTFIDMRRNEVLMQGRMPSDAQRALKMLENQGNPFGSQEHRLEWIKELNLRVIKPGEECDVIYWIGCCTTFDPTKQTIASSICTLLEKTGLSFGVLGSDEHCCGDPARVLGQEHLFQQMASTQIEAIKSRKFRVLLVSCPHCFNVLKNEYRYLGGDFNVVHHTEFLHEALWSGLLRPEMGFKGKYVYHDPCYLGRYQKIYQAPREVIKSIPGVELLEMKNSKEKSLCCGGGGGHYWMDLHGGERINTLRVKQAVEVGANNIVTGCAYCKQMLEDSVKLENKEEDVRVLDIATLVLESVVGRKARPAVSSGPSGCEGATTLTETPGETEEKYPSCGD